MYGFDAHGCSVMGRERKRNEDTYFLDPRNGIFVIADGLGGRPGGGQSSKLAATTLAETVLQFAPGERTESHSLTYAAQAAHDAVRAMSDAEPHMNGAGTTLSAVVMAESVGAVVHVGDSRIYRFSGGRLTQVTRDHTMTAEMVARNQMTEAEARLIPFGNALSRAIGNGQACQPDIEKIELRAGDWLILATDGLWNAISNDMLEKVLIASATESAKALCDAIMAPVQARQPADDTTVAAIRFVDKRE